MIVFILILSFILRLISLNQSLWLDEATTALVAKMPIADFFAKFMPADFHPPLYYLVVGLWSTVFGYSEIALRLPSVIFGILTVYTVYLIAKELKFKLPIVPALFLATSGLHIYYSQEARMYAMATWLVSYLVYVYLRKKWIIFALILPLIFLTDYVSLLILPALFIYVLIYSKKDLKKFIFSFLPLIFTSFLWLPFFVKQIASGLELKASSPGWWSILGPVTFKNVVLIPIKFIIGRITIDDKTIYLIVIATLLTFFTYFLSKAKNRLVWTWLLVSLVLGIFLSFFIPTLTYFRYLFVLPSFYLLISENANKFVIIFVLCINLLTSGFYLLDSSFHRENWREIAKKVGQDKVVMAADSQKEALIYYGKEKQIIRKEELGVSDKTVWLSRYVWNIFDPTDSTRKKLNDLGYNWTEEVNLNGVVFWKYTK